jgi:hypothetical protein
MTHCAIENFWDEVRLAAIAKPEAGIGVAEIATLRNVLENCHHAAQSNPEAWAPIWAITEAAILRPDWSVRRKGEELRLIGQALEEAFARRCAGAPPTSYGVH